MGGQKIQGKSVHDSHRIAGLFDVIRDSMTKEQYGANPASPHPRAVRFQAIADRFNAHDVLDACIGSGPNLTGLKAVPLSRTIICSDGGDAMLEILRKNHPDPDLHHRVFQVQWTDLPKFFGKGRFDLVTINGNSMGYSIGWEGIHVPIEKQIELLRATLHGVHEVLRSNGIFLFDVPAYTQNHLEFPDMVVDGKPTTIFVDVVHENGLRHFILSTASERYDLVGMDLNAGTLIDEVRRVGFSSVEELPLELQLDPIYYRAYAAHKH